MENGEDASESFAEIGGPPEDNLCLRGVLKDSKLSYIKTPNIWFLSGHSDFIGLLRVKHAEEGVVD